jgi:hypothetical protein
MKFSEHDCVRTVCDFPEYSIAKGEIGTVIITFSKPNEAYEIEFDNGNGRPKATFPILPKDLEKAF